MTRLLAVASTATVAAVLFGSTFGTRNGLVAGAIIGCITFIVTDFAREHERLFHD